MDDRQQADGEKRVRQMLIEPLMRRGLAKPSSLTRAEFDEMTGDICSRLAYMDALSLAALEEHAATNPGGKDRDRFPIANNILAWAAAIQPPDAGASPLMRAVFASPLGLDAITQGWAPELLSAIRKDRRWPNAYVVSAIKDQASDAVRRLALLEDRLRRGEDLTNDEAQWRDRRVAATAKCREIRELGAAEVSE